LEKDSDERFQSVHDLKLELQGIAKAAPATQAPSAASSHRRWLPWAAAGVLAVTALLFAVAYMQSLRAPAYSVHSYILPPEKGSFVLAGNTSGPPVVSPDGLRLAFVARNAEDKQMLWIQPLNSRVAQPMAGTNDATFPFWSADSRYVGFFAGGKLNKVEASGGPPQALCDATAGRGGTWNSSGTIVFAPTAISGLERVDAAGGTPVPLTTVDTKESSHRWPEFLPDGRHFLYFAHGAATADDGIYVTSLDSKERRLVLRNDSNALYAAPGYLLFVRDQTLMAQRFDTRQMTLEGEAQPLADHVVVNTNVWRGLVTSSANGALLYQHGAASGGSQLVWFDASGKPGQLVVPETASYYEPVLSPDGSKLAVAIDSNGVRDVWVVDLARNTKTRVTFGPQASNYPVWWPDSKSLVFDYGAPGAANALYRKQADGAGGNDKLLEAPGITQIPFSVSSDGRYLAYMRLDTKSPTNWDIWALPMFGDRKPFPVVSTQFPDVSPSLSPEGKWLAYANNESGRVEVYIQPFPNGSGRWQVSTAGGTRPTWRKDGKELFFQTPDQQMMAVDVRENGASLQLGTPHALFKATTVSAPEGPYAVSADGKKFIMNTVTTQGGSEPLTLVTNWTADLRK
ncbi:MAG TPA: hypothetical protein VGR48_09250, partial [Terriglobales bacterium]|nr:hypothetical protein [Terriglobales bacterium]